MVDVFELEEPRTEVTQRDRPQWGQQLAGEGVLGEGEVPGLEGGGGDGELTTERVCVSHERLVLSECGVTGGFWAVCVPTP